ncbi:MAG: hypothetical protein LOD89_06200, partial [Tissierellales bacterium]
MLDTSYVSLKGKKQKKQMILNRELVFLGIVAFFISRASVIDKLTPFGIAFISSYLLTGRYNLYVIISAVLG